MNSPKVIHQYINKLSGKINWWINII